MSNGHILTGADSTRRCIGTSVRYVQLESWLHSPPSVGSRGLLECELKHRNTKAYNKYDVGGLNFCNYIRKHYAPPPRKTCLCRLCVGSSAARLWACGCCMEYNPRLRQVSNHYLVGEGLDEVMVELVRPLLHLSRFYVQTETVQWSSSGANENTILPRALGRCSSCRV